MKRADLVDVDKLRDDFTSAHRTFVRALERVFGELVYTLDEVIDRHNRLETSHTQLEKRIQALEDWRQQGGNGSKGRE